MGHPDALKGRAGQAESGKKGISPADGHTARDGRFLPTASADVNRNGPLLTLSSAPYPHEPHCTRQRENTDLCQVGYIV
jgi:hypothetical protein